MRGGTVLHKGHLAPASRYSEDIDLVLLADRSHAGIRDDIAAALKPLLGEPSESIITNVRLTIRNLLFKSEIARLTYVYDPTSQQPEKSIRRAPRCVHAPPFKDCLRCPCAGGSQRRWCINRKEKFSIKSNGYDVRKLPTRKIP